MLRNASILVIVVGLIADVVLIVDRPRPQARVERARILVVAGDGDAVIPALQGDR